MAKSLLDVLRDVSLDPSEQAAFAADTPGYLAQYGYEDVQAEDLAEALSLVADTLPPEAAATLPSAGPTSEAAATTPTDVGDDFAASEPYGPPTGGALDAGYGADFAEDDDGVAGETDDTGSEGGSADISTGAGEAADADGPEPGADDADAMGFGEGSVEAAVPDEAGGFADWSEAPAETVQDDAAFDQGALGDELEADDLGAAGFSETDDGFTDGGDDFGAGDALGGSDDLGGDDFDDIGSF